MPQFTQQALDWLCLILQEHFDQVFSLEYRNNTLVMRIDNLSGEVVFNQLIPAFLQTSTEAPCASWDAESEGLVSVMGGEIPAPGVAKLPSPLIQFDAQASQATIHYDILGLTYWMLNRIEEINSTKLDNHGRFPATSSHAFKHGYLERPIVDEWLHVLGQVIQKVWPDAQLKKHQFSMKVSHDVDSPSLYAFKPWKNILRMMAGHLLKRRDLKAFLLAPYVKLTSSKQISKHDPHNTFDWLMNVSEQHGLQSAFYFICGRTSNMDADYEPEHPIIRQLMRHMHERGHEIGLHPSYGTYQKPELIKQEADRLRASCKQAGVKQESYGGRMHYLRWQHPTTMQAWNDAGMAYDTTLSYADRPGFRCGTCFEYPAFNHTTQQVLTLRIRPLIAMECTVIDEVYLGLGVTQAAEEKFLELKDKCKRVGGCFTTLWHNSYFAKDTKTKEIYRKLFKG